MLPFEAGLVWLLMTGCVFLPQSSFAQTPTFSSHVIEEGDKSNNGRQCAAQQTSADMASVSLRCVSQGGTVATGKAYASLGYGLLSESNNFAETSTDSNYTGGSASITDVISVVGPLPSPEKITLRVMVSGSISGASDPDEFFGVNLMVDGNNLTPYLYGYDGVAIDPVSSFPSQSGNGYKIISLAANHIRLGLTVVKTVSDKYRDVGFTVSVGGTSIGYGCDNCSYTQSISFPRVQLSVSLPPGLTFTSASGVLLTQ